MDLPVSPFEFPCSSPSCRLTERTYGSGIPRRTETSAQQLTTIRTNKNGTTAHPALSTMLRRHNDGAQPKSNCLRSAELRRALALIRNRATEMNGYLLVLPSLWVDGLCNTIQGNDRTYCGQCHHRQNLNPLKA